MRLLLLGGTAWLGRTIAEAAIHHDHQVTCLARGQSGTPPNGARFVRADRDAPDAYDEVARHTWDVVVDVARQPGQVRRAVDALCERSAAYLFVSSASVYADHGTPGADESAALLPALDDDVMADMDSYGQAKVACEQHVLHAYGPDRSLIVRAGLIGGPGDVSGRTGYWPLRFSRAAAGGGSVLVPDAPDLTVQVVDVRDLGAWVVDAAERRVHGVVNAVGDAVPFPEHIEVARRVGGHTGHVVRADPDWLVEQGVEPWMGERSLPLWLPLPEYAGLGSRDGSAVRRAGLLTRPLADTLADTLAWELETGPDRPRHAGLSAEDERRLLEALALDR